MYLTLILYTLYSAQTGGIVARHGGHILPRTGMCVCMCVCVCVYTLLCIYI
jgi:hypothetical protein